MSAYLDTCKCCGPENQGNCIVQVVTSKNAGYSYKGALELSTPVPFPGIAIQTSVADLNGKTACTSQCMFQYSGAKRITLTAPVKSDGCRNFFRWKVNGYFVGAVVGAVKPSLDQFGAPDYDCIPFGLLFFENVITIDVPIGTTTVEAVYAQNVYFNDEQTWGESPLPPPKPWPCSCLPHGGVPGRGLVEAGAVCIVTCKKDANAIALQMAKDQALATRGTHTCYTDYHGFQRFPVYDFVGEYHAKAVAPGWIAIGDNPAGNIPAGKYVKRFAYSGTNKGLLRVYVCTVAINSAGDPAADLTHFTEVETQIGEDFQVTNRFQGQYLTTTDYAKGAMTTIILVSPWPFPVIAESDPAAGLFDGAIWKPHAVEITRPGITAARTRLPKMIDMTGDFSFFGFPGVFNKWTERTEWTFLGTFPGNAGATTNGTFERVFESEPCTGSPFLNGGKLVSQTQLPNIPILNGISYVWKVSEWTRYPNIPPLGIFGNNIFCQFIDFSSSDTVFVATFGLFKFDGSLVGTLKQSVTLSDEVFPPAP